MVEKFKTPQIRSKIQLLYCGIKRSMWWLKQVLRKILGRSFPYRMQLAIAKEKEIKKRKDLNWIESHFGCSHHPSVWPKPLFWFRFNTVNPNWRILSANTVTDTETTSQRKNLVTDSIGYFFHHKRAPKTKFSATY